VQFAFTEDQRLFRDTVREIFANECPPTAVRDSWTNDTGRVPGLWRLLADTGVVGLTAPEALGGLGMTEVDLVLLLEESGRAASPEPLLEHTAVGIPLLRDHAPEAMAASWLPRAAGGEAVLAVGLASHRYVLGGAEADLLLLQHGDELHAVPRDEVTCTPQPSVDQSRRLVTVGWSPSPATLVVGGVEGRQAAKDVADRGALGATAARRGVVPTCRRPADPDPARNRRRLQPRGPLRDWCHRGACPSHHGARCRLRWRRERGRVHDVDHHDVDHHGVDHHDVDHHDVDHHDVDGHGADGHGADHHGAGDASGSPLVGSSHGLATDGRTTGRRPSRARRRTRLIRRGARAPRRPGRGARRRRPRRPPAPTPA
jgi:hypothetical protein